MNPERRAYFGLMAAMVVVGSLVWWIQLRPHLEVDPAPLAALPLELGSWRGRDIPVEDTVERMLNADYNVQRAYRRDGAGEVVWLYVGYYGTARGGRPEHTPEVCYPSAGWEIAPAGALASDGGETARSSAAWTNGSTVMRVSRPGERRLVQYWYRSSLAPRRAHRLALSVDHMRSRLRGGRADGALVRISTPIRDGDESGAAARLAAFGAQLEAALARHWPGEGPAT